MKITQLYRILNTLLKIPVTNDDQLYLSIWLELRSAQVPAFSFQARNFPTRNKISRGFKRKAEQPNQSTLDFDNWIHLITTASCCLLGKVVLHSIPWIRTIQSFAGEQYKSSDMHSIHVWSNGLIGALKILSILVFLSFKRALIFVCPCSPSTNSKLSNLKMS